MTRTELLKSFDHLAQEIEKDPTNIVAFTGAATIAMHLGKFDEAGTLARQAIQRFEGRVTCGSQDALSSANLVLGNIAMRELQYVKANSYFQTSLLHNPTNASTICSQGLLEERSGNLRHSKLLFEKAFSLKRNDPQITCNLGMRELAEGDFVKGWDHYFMRHVASLQRGIGRDFQKLPWITSTQDIPKKLFVWAEQGLGEQIMFSKFLYELYDLDHSEITLEVEERLVPVFKRSLKFLKDVVATKKELDASYLDDFDGHMCLSDVPALFVKNKNDIKVSYNHYGWLKADPVRTRNMAESFAGGIVKVGVSWQSPKAKVGLKSIDIKALAPIFNTFNVGCVSLQYGLTETQVQDIKKSNLPINGLWPVGMDDDIDGLFAKIAACDVVLTTSNATAHMAGALGIPTIVLVPAGYGLHWHWFYDTPDSPWYGSVSLIRQSKQGSWDSAIKQAIENVKEIASTGG